ncbi:MAG: hypothetical protein JKX69_10630 [Rhodobacteraceae bacterium]|nr:hypothetical protein [Paracoccaceae bacterium]
MRISYVSACAALAGVLALPVAAQDALSLLNVSTNTYERLESWDERGLRPAGVVEILENEGMVIAEIRGVFDVPWTEELSRLSIRASDIKLVLGDGTEVESFGDYSNLGQLDMGGPSISMSRPRDFPDGDAHLYYEAMFMVPSGTTSGTLTFAGDMPFSQLVNFPPPAEPVGLDSFARIEIVNVDIFRTIRLKRGRDTQEVHTSITAPPGFVLVDIEVEVFGVATNEFEDDGDFVFRTTDFRLVGSQWGDLALIGERFSSRILDYQYSAVDIGESTTRNWVWLVPEGLPNAVINYGEAPMVEVTFADVVVQDEG